MSLRFLKASLYRMKNADAFSESVLQISSCRTWCANNYSLSFISRIVDALGNGQKMGRWEWGDCVWRSWWAVTISIFDVTSFFG